MFITSKIQNMNEHVKILSSAGMINSERYVTVKKQ